MLHVWVDEIWEQRVCGNRLSIALLLTIVTRELSLHWSLLSIVSVERQFEDPAIRSHVSHGSSLAEISTYRQRKLRVYSAEALLASTKRVHSHFHSRFDGTRPWLSATSSATASFKFLPPAGRVLYHYCMSRVTTGWCAWNLKVLDGMPLTTTTTSTGSRAPMVDFLVRPMHPQPCRHDDTPAKTRRLTFLRVKAIFEIARASRQGFQKVIEGFVP